MKRLTELIQKYKQTILYLIFGVLTTAVNLATYTLFVELFRVEMTISNSIAWVVGVIFAFVTNRRYVFESGETGARAIARQFLSFTAGRAVSGVIEISLPTLLFNLGLTAELFGVEGSVAKISVSVIVIILNYLFSRFIVFKK